MSKHVYPTDLTDVFLAFEELETSQPGTPTPMFDGLSQIAIAVLQDIINLELISQPMLEKLLRENAETFERIDDQNDQRMQLDTDTLLREIASHLHKENQP